MNYDADVDTQRLSQLAEQFIPDNPVEGRVLFLSNHEGDYLEHARWQIDDATYETFNASGFKLHLMELINILIIYRTQCQQPNSNQGIVYIRKNKLSIEWLPKIQVEALFEY